MPPGSQDSASDIDRIQTRTRYTSREPSPEAQTNGIADSDIVAVGALFRRESDARPRSLVISEGGEINRNSLQILSRDEVSSDGDAVMTGDAELSRSPPATPTPTRHHPGAYIQPSDISEVRRQRRTRRGRRVACGPGSQSSIDPYEQRQGSDTSNEDDGDEDEDEDANHNHRGRSTTPVPSFPPSYTPSVRSQQTEEDHGEGYGPMSPLPYSSYFPYDPQHQQRTEAIEGVEQRFPVDEQQPGAE